MKAKKAVSLLLCILMVFSCVQMSVCASAEPYNLNIATSSCSFDISGINSTSRASMKTASKMSISICMELQKIKSGVYTTIETWSQSKTGISLALEETRLINALATYRLKVTFKAGSETIVRYAYPWWKPFS